MFDSTVLINTELAMRWIAVVVFYIALIRICYKW